MEFAYTEAQKDQGNNRKDAIQVPRRGTCKLDSEIHAASQPTSQKKKKEKRRNLSCNGCLVKEAATSNQLPKKQSEMTIHDLAFIKENENAEGLPLIRKKFILLFQERRCGSTNNNSQLIGDRTPKARVKSGSGGGGPTLRMKSLGD